MGQLNFSCNLTNWTPCIHLAFIFDLSTGKTIVVLFHVNLSQENQYKLAESLQIFLLTSDFDNKTAFQNYLICKVQINFNT